MNICFFLCLFIGELLGDNLQNRVEVGILIPGNDRYESFIYRETIKAIFQNQSGYAMVYSPNIEMTGGCNPIIAGGKTSELIYNKKVAVMIGPSCTSSCSTSIKGAQFAHTTLISYGCTEIQSSPDFPNFIRTKPFAREHATGIVSFLLNMAIQFNWKNLGIIFSTNYGWIGIKDKVKEMLQAKDLKIETYAIQAYMNNKFMIDDVKLRTRSNKLFLECDLFCSYKENSNTYHECTCNYFLNQKL